jgi:sugar phosphate permease
MIGLSHRQRGRWISPLYVAIWFSAVIFTIILGILFVTKVVGNWVVLIPGVLAMGMGLWRYRVETEQKKRSADDQGE